MAVLTLREHLIVDYPGEALPMLQQLATFERIGRLRPGQHRVVRYWRLTNDGQRLILPRGLFVKVQRLLPGSSVRDERFVTRPVDMGFHADLRDYQAAMVDALYQRQGGVMVMPPSAGKTRSALALVDQWQQPALFLVHQLRLLDKTLGDARKLYRLPRGGLGAIADGRTQIGTHFTVATIQTLASKPRIIKQLIPRVGTVVIDECHHLGSPSYQKVISAFPAKHRLGLSVGGDTWITVRHDGNIERLTLKEMADRLSLPVDHIIETPGYETWTYDLGSKSFRWVKLKAVHRYRNTKPAFALKTDYGRRITVTEDHSIFRMIERPENQFYRNNQRKYRPAIEVATGSELSVGDYLIAANEADTTGAREWIDLATVTRSDVFITGPWKDEMASIFDGHGPQACKARYRYKTGKTHGAYLPLPIYHANALKLSPLTDASIIYGESSQYWTKARIPAVKIARLIGYLIGNGSLSADRISIINHTDKVQELLDYLDTMSPWASIGVNVKEMSDRSKAREIVLSCRPLTLWIGQFFGGYPKAHEKRIPPEVWSWPIDARRELLEGLMATDGHVAFTKRNSARVYYTTTSTGLAYDMIHLLEGLGIIASLYCRKAATGGFVRGRQIIGRHDVCVVHWPYHALTPRVSLETGQRSHFDMEDWSGFPVKIRNIQPVAADEVFDLSTETETFCGNGLVLHNSATPDRDDGLGPIVYATVGTPIRVSRAGLANKGVVIDPTIYIVRTHWTPPDDVPFHVAEEQRATSSERNVLIFKLVAQARSRGLRVLVLVEREIHATILAQILTRGGVAAHPAFGRLPQPVQDRHFKWMEQGHAVVVATKLANEGLDWPALDCLVLATPGRSPTVLEQRTGRIARIAEGKTFALVYDLADDGALYQDQTRARVAKYQEMGYRIRRFTWPSN